MTEEEDFRVPFTKAGSLRLGQLERAFGRTLREKALATALSERAGSGDIDPPPREINEQHVQRAYEELTSGRSSKRSNFSKALIAIGTIALGSGFTLLLVPRVIWYWALGVIVIGGGMILIGYYLHPSE